MYEYAATAMAPIKSGDSLEATNIEVGPSAPPIIDIAEASLSVKLNQEVYSESTNAPTSEPNIPN